ncbi:hypothetical protein Tco_1344531 [Tanacetum coccineum]
MDDPNITIEEYIRIEEEKTQKRGKVFNRETARISFDKSDDEDYMVVFYKNSFSYKIISTNDFKTDSKNDNEKVSVHLFPSSEPTISCIDDLDFFKDFENEFLAIVYNDALTSKSDFLTKPTLCPHHINEFDLKDETSMSGYDEMEQNILNFNDLFPFNIIYPDDLKSDKGNDDNEIDMIQSSGDMAPLPPREQRHPFLRYQGLEYSDQGYARANEGCSVCLDADGHRDGDGVVLFTSEAWGRVFDTRGPLFQLGGARRHLSWREFILALGLHIGEEMKSLGFARYWSESERMIPMKGDLRNYWRDISTDGDLLGPTPSYTLIRDPLLSLCHRFMAHSIAGRSQTPEKSHVVLVMPSPAAENIILSLSDVWCRFVVLSTSSPTAATAKLMGSINDGRPQRARSYNNSSWARNHSDSSLGTGQKQWTVVWSRNNGGSGISAKQQWQRGLVPKTLAFYASLFV